MLAVVYIIFIKCNGYFVACTPDTTFAFPFDMRVDMSEFIDVAYFYLLSTQRIVSVYLHEFYFNDKLT